MKITNQVKGFLVVMLAVVSILPGCGKSKNNDQGIIVGGPPPQGVITNPPTTPVTPIGGCTSISAAGDGSMTFPVSGSAQIGVTGFYSAAYVGGAGYTGGTYYHRVNASGDTIDLSLSGSTNSTGTASATVHLSPTTVAALGGANMFCVYGVLFNNSGLTSGSPGTVYGNIWLYTSRATIGLQLQFLQCPGSRSSKAHANSYKQNAKRGTLVTVEVKREQLFTSIYEKK